MKLEIDGIAGGLVILTVLAGSQARAQLAPAKQSVAPSAGDELASKSAQAELAGDHERALLLANDAIKTAPNDPWGHYSAGDALGSLQRIDDAVAAFRQAEQHFAETESWGRSIAIWGQANVLRQVGRCNDAFPIFERYAAYVEKLDPDAAALALKYQKYCAPRAAPR
jgi:tetratricopeptide (TPR) repeat protein